METVPYLKSKTAYMLWFVKIILGVLSYFTIKDFLDLTLPVLLNIPHSMGHYELKLSMVMGILTSNNMFGINSLIQDINMLANGMRIISLLAFLFYTPVLGLALLMPVLYVVEALAGFLMLTRGIGLKLMKFTHALCTLMIGFILGSTIGILILTYDRNVPNDNLALLTFFFVSFGFGMLILFCVEKDLYFMMDRISEHMQGVKKSRRSDHLSGLSFFCGILTSGMLCLGLIYCVSIEFHGFNPLELYTTIFVILQFFLVSGLNKKIKKYDKEY